MIIPKLKNALAYGGDYNPEQWPESVWHEDVALMKEAGVNLVSVGIFSWAKLQPSPDSWIFDWLDTVLDLLAENQIYACLATATASPPAWLTRLHPEILPVNADGQTLFPGSRQQYSPSSSAYREAAAVLVSKIADRYASHPALAAWHINNEYACHMPECHSDESTAAFRLWLQRKYKSVDALNEAWGTAFWSQIYTDWDEVLTPRKAPYFNNPSQQLDFKRFTSDAFLELLLLEKRILKARTPDIPVNTNFMGFFKPLDYHRWAEELDFTSWDSYPDPLDEKADRLLHAAGNDLTRSLKPNQPFVLMEQATSAVNWREINRPKRPGLMRLNSLQSVARGADGIMFFQWRASKAGTEKFHSAMVQHCGAENSRVFREVCSLGDELKRLHPVSGSKIQSSVGILFDWHAWWSVEIDSRPGRIDYAAWAQTIHAWFYERNIAVDFVSPNSKRFDEYRLLIAPALYLLDTEDAARFESFTAEGGTVLATYFSGIVDRSDHVYLGGYPGALRNLLGLWVEEWCPLGEAQENAFAPLDSESRFACDHWCDIAHLESAKALASFSEDFFAGSPAFTENDFGKGKAFYLATRPNAAGLDFVLENTIAAAKISPVLQTPAGVEAVERVSATHRFLFLLNHLDAPESLTLPPRSHTNLITGASHTDSIVLNGFDCAVLESPLDL